MAFSCILVLPILQRKDYEHLLIDFSYLLTRVKNKTRSPEKPLLDGFGILAQLLATCSLFLPMGPQIRLQDP